MTVTVVEARVQFSADSFAVKWLFCKIYVAFDTYWALKSEPPPLVIIPGKESTNNSD